MKNVFKKKRHKIDKYKATQNYYDLVKMTVSFFGKIVAKIAISELGQVSNERSGGLQKIKGSM